MVACHSAFLARRFGALRLWSKPKQRHTKITNSPETLQPTSVPATNGTADIHRYPYLLGAGMVFLFSGCSTPEIPKATSQSAKPLENPSVAISAKIPAGLVGAAAETTTEVSAGFMSATSAGVRATGYARLTATTSTGSATPSTFASPSFLIDRAADTNEFEHIKAELGATQTIETPGPPGDLRIWIGAPEHNSNFPSELARASALIPVSTEVRTVRVSPNAPAFEISPSESICAKFDPTGTAVNFQLTPKFERDGSYPVGAGILLYASEDCSGQATPKAATDIKVKVVVRKLPDDTWKTLREYLAKLWAGILALMVALILFLTRRTLKKMFGFEEK